MTNDTRRLMTMDGFGNSPLVYEERRKGERRVRRADRAPLGTAAYRLSVFDSWKDERRATTDRRAAK